MPEIMAHGTGKSKEKMLHPWAPSAVTPSKGGQLIMLKEALNIGMSFVMNNQIYSLVLNKRPPRLLIFGNFSHPPGPYLDPPLINLGKFLLQQLQNIQNYTVNKGYFD